MFPYCSIKSDTVSQEEECVLIQIISAIGHIVNMCLFVPMTDPVMEEGSEVVEDIIFRGVEFSVKIEVVKGVLVVEISELLTADQWRGEFDPACEYYTLNFSEGASRNSLICEPFPLQMLKTSPAKLATSSSSLFSAAC